MYHYFIKKRFLLVVLSAVAAVGCNKWVGIQDPTQNPVGVFDEAWKTMDRNYALFPLKEIDWDSVHAVEKVKITDQTGKEELFDIMSDMLSTLKDGHVTLISVTDTSTYEGFYKSYPANFNLENIKENYLHNEYSQKADLIYKIQDGIGYLYDASFRNGISTADLDQVMRDLAGTRGLIIDVRNNTGGDLSNAENLFSHFIQSRQLVKYERMKKGPDHTDYKPDEPLYVSPSGIFYDHPVIVLTNRKCFSACNDFVMYMSALPSVQLVGDQTGGGGAIPADFLLSNGWKLQYSASLTLSPYGIPSENGIAPDYEVNINAIDDANGRDPILEKAIELLQ